MGSAIGAHFALIILSVFALVSAGTPAASSELATGAAKSSQATRASSTPTCQSNFDQYNCSSLANDPELKDYVRQCDQKVADSDYSEVIRSCLSSGAGAWGEVIKSLRDAPRAISYGIAEDLKEKAKPVVQLNLYLKSCLGKIDCKKNLFRVGRGREPTPEEIQDLEGYEKSWFPAPYTKIEALWNRAASRHHSINVPMDPWMEKQITQIFGAPKKQEAPQNLISDIKEVLNQKQNKFNCLNSAGQAEMICYGLFTVLDPALAYSTATKLPRLAKLVEATKSAAASTAQQTTRKLGEKYKELKDAVAEANGPPKTIPMIQNYRGEQVGESILGKTKVKYLESDLDRAPYFAQVKDGKIIRQDGENFGPWDPAQKPNSMLVKARANHNIDSAIYVLNEEGRLLVNPAPIQGKFHHSSFMAGQPVRGAGEIQMDRTGKVLSISNSSGHYAPSEEVLNRTISELKAMGIPLREKQRIRPPDKPGVVVVEFY